MLQLLYEIADTLHLDRDILELIVGPFDIHQRYVFVAITGIGVFLTVTQQWVVVVYSKPVDGHKPKCRCIIKNIKEEGSQR